MSKLTLVIGNKNYSSWSLRPWLLLRHNRIPFDEIRIALSQPTTAEALRPHSPTLKVPVLKDGALTVWDSLAICEYVSEQYLGGKGWPQQVAARAQARAFAAEMHSGFQALRSNWPMNVRLQRKLPVEGALQRDIGRVSEIWTQCLDKSGGPGSTASSASSMRCSRRWRCAFTPTSRTCRHARRLTCRRTSIIPRCRNGSTQVAPRRR